MNRSEGIAMADEQNQGNTIINQGTTIDNLPGLDGMSQEHKHAFIDSAFVPIRGTISGEMATRKVTGSDLAASGENKIDSIAVAGTTIEPVNKHVNIPLATTTAAGVMSANDKTKLDELKGVPDPTIFAASGGDVLTLDNNGNARWSPPPTPEIDSISVDETVLDIDANKNVNIPLGDGLVYDADGGGVHTLHAKLDGSGGIEASSEGHLYVSTTLPLYTYDEPKNSIFLGYDETLALNDDGELVVANPVPSPSNEPYNKMLLNHEGTVQWDNNMSFGSGSTEYGVQYIPNLMLVKVPKDFEDDHGKGWATDFDLEWQTATPPAPYPDFGSQDEIGATKSYLLTSTLRNKNADFWNSEEHDYSWEETTPLPSLPQSDGKTYKLTCRNGELAWVEDV